MANHLCGCGGDVGGDVSGPAIFVGVVVMLLVVLQGQPYLWVWW